MPHQRRYHESRFLKRERRADAQPWSDAEWQIGEALDGLARSSVAAEETPRIE